MDGRLGAYVRGEIGKRGLVAFDRHVGQRLPADHQCDEADPHAGRPRRVQDPGAAEPALDQPCSSAFGASPTSINFSEVYSALQTRLVDGQENPLAVIDTAKLYEVQKYLSVTNHMWDGFWFLANRRALEALPKDVQEIVRAGVQPVGAGGACGCGAAERVAAKARCSRRAWTSLRPTRLPSAPRCRKAGFYAEWKAKYGAEAWGVLEGAVGSWPEWRERRRPAVVGDSA